MKTLKVSARNSRSRYTLVPTSWAEGHDMIERTMQEGFANGNDSTLSSACERVVLTGCSRKYNAPRHRVATALAT